MDQLDEYIQEAKRSVFRFEGLQDYSAMDGEDFVRKYLESNQLSFQPAESEWWKSIKALNQKGIKTSRVRMVTDPLTDYTKAELAHLKASADYSAEDIRTIGEESVKEIAPGLSDFYLIDEGSLFIMRYGSKGKYLGSDLVQGLETKRYSDIAKELIKSSKPIE